MTQEPIGSVAEEAAKLFAAVQGWLGEHADPGDAAGGPGGAEDADRPVQPDQPDQPDQPSGPDSEATHRHAGTECRWCPLCQLVRAAKATSPEVRDHLSQAAVSFAMAIRGLLDDRAARGESGPVERVEVDDADDGPAPGSSRAFGGEDQASTRRPEPMED